MQKTDSTSPFAESVRIFSHDFLKCCKYISKFNDSRQSFAKRLYSKLVSTSQLLEDFLDFHGAKNNKDWCLYRELTATVRHLSTASYSYKHISNRLSFYDLVDTENFEKEGDLTFNFLTSSIMKIVPVVLDEAKRLNIPIPEGVFNPAYFPLIPTGNMLDYNIDDDDKDQQQKHIVKIASKFLSIAGDFEHLGFYEPYNMEEILAIVPDKVNEVEIRYYEMLVHNLQSSFDTYVIHGGLRFGNRRLKQLRGHISIVFHLLQMIGRLLHFYERHLYRAGYKSAYKKVQDRLTSLVNPSELLNCTINYGLYHASYFLMAGKGLARDILNENIERSSITVGIPVKLGFHSRPSLLVAKIVQHYGGQVELCIGSDRFDASSVLDIQWAGGKIENEKITKVVFEGDVRALKNIEMLASVNYGEDTMGKGIPLPEELSYLR